MTRILRLALPLLFAATFAFAQSGTGLAPGAMSGAGTGLAPGGGGLAAPMAGPTVASPGLSGPMAPQVLPPQPPIPPEVYVYRHHTLPDARPK